VLHTWTQKIEYHPHLHCIVSGGGLSADGGRWISTRPNFLFPLQVMGRLFRGKMLDALRRAASHAKLRIDDPARFAALLASLYDLSRPLALSHSAAGLHQDPPLRPHVGEPRDHPARNGSRSAREQDPTGHRNTDRVRRQVQSEPAYRQVARGHPQTDRYRPRNLPLVWQSRNRTATSASSRLPRPGPSEGGMTTRARHRRSIELAAATGGHAKLHPTRELGAVLHHARRSERPPFPPLRRTQPAAQPPAWSAPTGPCSCRQPLCA
jgi:hypothetical protein